MTDKQQPEALRLANVCSNLTRYSMDAHLIAAELRRMHAENTTLQAGYAAARLEIESLKSQSAAQRSGAAYAALSDAEIDRIVPALEPVSEDFPVEWALWKDRGRIRNELRTSHGQAPAQPVATAGGSLARIIEEKIAAMTPSEASAFMAARAELAASGNDQAAPDMRDPYGGAREDLAIWRKRALEAEALNRKFATSVNGPTFMGEPADSDGALMAREIHESQDDSLLLCASDLQHSAIYDNHVEMQSCMRAVAARIAALVHAAPKAEPAAPAAVVWPSDPSITLDFKMASKLLDMFGGEPGLVTLQHGGEKCHSGAGLYAWYSDLPEEGAVFLGAEPDDEAAPTTQPAPQQAVQEPAYPSLPPADEVVHPRTSEPYALWGLIKLMDYAKAYHAANAPQPVERKPLTDEQWQRIADLTNSILTRATKDEIERVIGIKGGQHGTE